MAGEETMPREQKRKLRSVLIHKPMQREFTLVAMSLLIISALVVGLVIHQTIQEAMMGGGYRFGKISAYEVMSDVRYDIIARVSLVLFATIIVIGLFGVFFLHRIAGPVYRFRRTLQQVSKGEVPEEVRLREGDFFVETAEDLNHLLQFLRERRERIQNLRRRLEEAGRESVIPPSAMPLLTELKASLDQLA